MEKNNGCKIVISPKLLEIRRPMNDSYLDLVNKIKLKYEIYRWSNRLFKLTLRNMLLPYNDGFTNKVFINKYINSLEMYKAITKIDGKVLKQIYDRDKEGLKLPKSTVTNMIFKENTTTRLGEKTYKELDREGNKKLTLNKIYEIYFEIERKNIDLLKNNILNHLENIYLLNVTQNNAYKKIILKDAKTSINKSISKINAEATKKTSYLLLDRKQYKEKIVSKNKGQFGGEIIQSLDKGLQKFNTVNNNMYVWGRRFVKNYKYQNRNDGVSQNIVVSNVRFNNSKLHSILTNDITSNDRNYEYFLSKVHKKDYCNTKKAFKNIVTNQSIVKLRYGNIPLNLMDISNIRNLMDISSLTKEFYLKNINRLFKSQLVEDKYTKLVLNAQSEDKLRIFYDRTRAIKSENIKIYKNNTMTHLNHNKKEKRDSSGNETKEVKPIEKESYSRTFLSESKENRSFSNIDINEINILADRVFKVIEKRIEIRKDRRGVR